MFMDIRKKLINLFGLTQEKSIDKHQINKCILKCIYSSKIEIKFEYIYSSIDIIVNLLNIA